jgi:hypothetical protein
VKQALLQWEYEESERSHRVRMVQSRINSMHRKHLQRFSKELKNLEAYEVKGGVKLTSCVSFVCDMQANSPVTLLCAIQAQG